MSLGVILATFMGGTCLGSLLFPRLISANRRPPLRVYAAIGFLGIRTVGNTRFANDAPRLGSVLLFRGFVAAACLLPPTLLMGATLPALTRAVADEASQLGFLYGANIAGAVFGCLLAGFYLLRVYDVSTATYAAAAINAAVASLAFAPSRHTQDYPPIVSEPRLSRSCTSIYLAIALSGLCALASEALWTRMLGLLLGASVYTLSIILAVFLTGLGIGSAAGARFMPDPREPAPGIGLVSVASGRRHPRSGPPTTWPHRSPTGPLTPPSPRTSGSTFSSTSTAHSGLSCRRRCCGARASRWPSPPRHRKNKIRPNCLRAFTPRTPWGQSPEPSARAFCSSHG